MINDDVSSLSSSGSARFWIGWLNLSRCKACDESRYFGDDVPWY